MVKNLKYKPSLQVSSDTTIRFMHYFTLIGVIVLNIGLQILMSINKILLKSIEKIKTQTEDHKLDLEFKQLNDKSFLIINAIARKMVLITINALDAKNREVLSFGITVRKSNWEVMVQNHSEMELIGRLSNGPFKALTDRDIIPFIS